MNEKKALLRKEALSARSSLGKQRALAKSLAVSNFVISHPAFVCAKTILAYQAFSDELDVSLICKAAADSGKDVAFPLCRENGLLTAALPLNNKRVKNIYGIPEPTDFKIIEPWQLDFIIVPCVAFDSKLMRIGWGKGYYDRYLPQCINAFHGAVAFEAQRVEIIPADPWDRPMDAVITETGIHQTPCI